MVSLSREVFFALFLNQMKLFGRKKKQDDKTEYEQLRDDHGKNYEQNIKERSRGGEKGKKILFSFFKKKKKSLKLSIEKLARS